MRNQVSGLRLKGGGVKGFRLQGAGMSELWGIHGVVLLDSGSHREQIAALEEEPREHDQALTQS